LDAKMTATLEERLFSIISMVLVSLLTAGLPFYLLGRRRLNLRRMSFFCSFGFNPGFTCTWCRP
jgi:hypothetical protein